MTTPQGAAHRTGMSIPISAAAAGARETARSNDGKFGQQLRGEPPAPNMDTPFEELAHRIERRRLQDSETLLYATMAANENALAGTALRIRQFHPDATTLWIANDDEDGVIFNAADKDGARIALADDDDFRQHLNGYAWELDMGKPNLLQHFAKGHDSDRTDFRYPLSGSIEIREGNIATEVDEMWVDIDDMIGRINQPRFSNDD